VEANHNELLRGSHGRGSAASRAPEIPDATNRHGKAEHRGHYGKPSPACCSGRIHMKAQPRRQEPEPQGKESRTDQQRCQHYPRITFAAHAVGRLHFCDCHKDLQYAVASCAGLDLPIDLASRFELRLYSAYDFPRALVTRDRMSDSARISAL